MNQVTQERIYNGFVAFRATEDWMSRFDLFTRKVGRSRSQVCRYLISTCLSSYEADKDAIAKIRQSIL